MRKFLQEIIPITFLFLLLLGIFFPVLFLGKTFIDSGVIYCDLTNFYFSLKVWYQQELLSGHLPFWTNLIGNGYPIFAEGELGALYPPNLLFYLFLPAITAFNLNLFLHFLLAACSTYLFAHLSLKLSRSASILSALAYSLSGFFFARLSYVNMIFVISYFPLVLFLVERIVSKAKLYLAFLLALVFALQILAGYTEMFYYSFVLSFLFLLLLLVSGGALGQKSLFLGMSKGIIAFLLFILASFASFLLTSVQILPNYEVVQNSLRAEGLTFEAATSSTWPLSTLSLFVNPRAFDNYQSEEEYHPSNPTSFSIPTAYGYVGIFTLALALFALISIRKKRYTFIFVVMAILTFLWAQGRFTQLFTILWTLIPGLNFFRFPLKTLFGLEFFLAVLAGIGLDQLKEEFINFKAPSSRLVAILSLVLILLVYADLFSNNRRLQPNVSIQEWLSKPASVEFLENNLDKKYFQIYSHGTNNIDYQTTENSQLQKDFQNLLPPDLNMLFGLPANRETLALFLKRQQALNRENTTLDLEKQVLRLPPALKKSLALQGVKYLLSDVPFDDPDLTLVQEIPFTKAVDHMAFLKTGQTVKVKVGSTHIYENKMVYPRIHFVSRVHNLLGVDEEEILEKVLSREFNPQDEVIIEGPVEFKNDENVGSDVKLEIENYQEQETVIKIITQKPGFVVISRTFYPGWKATVDDQKTKIYKANYAFQAVQIPSGDHTVRLTFEPTYWRLGLGISAGTLLFVLLSLGYSLWKKV